MGWENKPSSVLWHILVSNTSFNVKKTHLLMFSSWVNRLDTVIYA